MSWFGGFVLRGSKKIQTSRRTHFFYAMEVSEFGQPLKGLREMFEFFQKVIDGLQYLVSVK